jgi:hypothetical protein
MNTLLQEVPALAITALLLILVGVLLVTHTILPSDLLVSTPLSTIVPYCFLRGAYQWQPVQQQQQKPTSTPPEGPTKTGGVS